MHYDTIYSSRSGEKDGAIACIDQDSKLISRISTPRISVSGPVDLTKEYVFCRDTIVENNPDRVVFVIEDVQRTVRGQHVLYSSLMENKGQLHGLFLSLCMAFTDISCSVNFIAPKTWQKLVWTHSDKVMEASKVNTKKTSLACAKRLWPNDTFVKNERCKTSHDGIVDAMLIAEAARRTI